MKTLLKIPAKLPLFAALLFFTAGCAYFSEDEGEFAAPFDIADAEESTEAAFDEVDFGELETVEDKARHLVVNIGDRIFFNVGQSSVTSVAQNTLRAQAAFLAQNSELDVTVEGHCDERGTREYNVALGLRRANAMRDALVSAGVDTQRIQVISYGKERPVAACSRDRCWKLNRRAVLTIDGAEGDNEQF